jgi:hypothetical protein
VSMSRGGEVDDCDGCHGVFLLIVNYWHIRLKHIGVAQISMLRFF